MGNVYSMILAAGLQISAGWLGHMMYPCEWPETVVLVAAGLGAAALAVCGFRAQKRLDEKPLFEKEEALIWQIWLGMLLCAVLLGAAAGMAFEKYVWINAVTGPALIAPLILFVLCWPSTDQETGKTRELNREKFPVICGILDEAVRRTGHRRRVRLFWGEGTASAFVQRSYDGIIVSPFFLMVLTKGELLQVFLHELAHLADEDVRREIRWRRLAARRAYIRMGLFRMTASPLLSASLRFGERLEEHLQNVYMKHELDADARAAKLGEGRYTASAAVKADFVEKFFVERESDGSDICTLGREFEAEVSGKSLTKPIESDPLLQKRVQSAERNMPVRETEAEWVHEIEMLWRTIVQKETPR